MKRTGTAVLAAFLVSTPAGAAQDARVVLAFLPEHLAPGPGGAEMW